MVAIKKPHAKKIKKYLHHTYLFLYIKAALWFCVGAVLGLFFLLSFTYISFKELYLNKAYPGVSIGNFNASGKTEQYIQNYFDQKNQAIAHSTFTFTYKDQTATLSAQQLELGYNSQLLAEQALSIGRGDSILSNVSLVFQTFLHGTNLPLSYTFSLDNLTAFLSPLQKIIYTAPKDAQFQLTNGRVTTFQLSQNGQDIDMDQLTERINQKIPYLLLGEKQQTIVIPIPLKVLQPKVTTQSVSNLGIKDLIGVGTSLFQGSAESRIYNVELAASRLNGVIVAPNEDFSFDQALGDVSSYTGYKQAYVIQGGRTVLGDGGGVCQVSTTMFRAILNAGLPVTERHAHDYRVEYYEEDGPPGIDATVYVPSVDLRFLNDTGHNILIQTVVDPNTLRLTFYLYGVKDGRQVTMTTPVVSNVIPAPAPLYQEDPSLPKGQTQQVDFAANGATVSFNRIVTKNGKQIINETYVSNYQPWQAVYLVGTAG